MPMVYNFDITPLSRLGAIDVENEMVVVAHNRIGRNVDGKEFGQ